MIFQQLPPFSPLANGTKATVQIPRLALTLGQVILCFPTGSSITKATISEIVVKVGSRVVFGPVTGAELDKVNKYKGLFDDAYHLCIDFFERDGLTMQTKEIGGYDLPNLQGQDVFVEVTNNAGAGTPIMSAIGVFSALQNNPNAKDPKTGKPLPKVEQAVRKLLKYTIPSTGGTLQTWMPQFRGATVHRIHFMYTGADWTATANGNVNRVLCKKNGIAVMENVDCRDLRFAQSVQRKVPQSKDYCLDFIVDNVHSHALTTSGTANLQFDITLGANDTITALVEVLDKPSNL